MTLDEALAVYCYLMQSKKDNPQLFMLAWRIICSKAQEIEKKYIEELQ